MSKMTTFVFGWLKPGFEVVCSSGQRKGSFDLRVLLKDFMFLVVAAGVLMVVLMFGLMVAIDFGGRYVKYQAFTSLVFGVSGFFARSCGVPPQVITLLFPLARLNLSS